MNASIHPPNELSLPRCYPEPRLGSKSSPNSPYSRSLSMEPVLRSKTLSPLGQKYKLHQRPKLKRETAQDFEDGDQQAELGREDLRSNSLSPNIFLKPTARKLIHQKSAPGTPMSPQRFNQCGRAPSRSPSDDSSGYLSVPKQRLRGSSISGDAQLSLRKVFKVFKHICSCWQNL